ncbi:MAG: HAD family hydrolase [Chthonomonadales bacterium]
MSLEIINADRPLGGFKTALFDFDGTLSLIREGWLNVMIPYFVEELAVTPNREELGEVERVVRDFVEHLTGKQTIYQCFQLQEEVKRRGGTPREALEYKHEYLRRLDIRIADRVDGLKSGAMKPVDLLVPGSIELLEALEARGVTSYLASGTDLPYVLAESDALDVTRYFDGRIYAAVDDYKSFSKQMIINKMIEDHALQGPDLLVIGDGYVEIENGRGAGGYAVGVASFESDPGQIDEWKRERLIRAGADIIIPDFADTDNLMKYLFPT